MNPFGQNINYKAKMNWEKILWDALHRNYPVLRVWYLTEDVNKACDQVARASAVYGNK